MGNALRSAVAESENAQQLLTFFYSAISFAGALFEGHGNPAGIQAQRLRLQDEMFSEIARLFFFRLLSDQSDIILNAAEIPIVRHKAFKSACLVGDHLNTQPAFQIAVFRFLFQNPDNIFGNRPVGIASHGMSCLHRF